MWFLALFRIVVGSCCILIGVLSFFVNYGVIIRYYSTKKSGSLVGPIGGLFLTMAPWVWPASGHFWPDQLRPWSWIALLLDPGCISTVSALTLLATGRRPKTRSL